MIHVDPALVAPAPAPAPAPSGAPASARALLERQQAMLSRLAEIGMAFAEAMGRQARDAGANLDPDTDAGEGADAAPAPTPAHPADAADPARLRDAGLAFARVARSVRMTIALQSRLARDLAILHREELRAAKTRRFDRRMRLSDALDEAVRTALAVRRASGERRWSDEQAMEGEAEHLADAAYERLTDAEDADPSGQSFALTVAGVCRDLGLPPDWTGRLMAEGPHADLGLHPGAGPDAGFASGGDGPSPVWPPDPAAAHRLDPAGDGPSAPPHHPPDPPA